MFSVWSRKQPHNPSLLSTQVNDDGHSAYKKRRRQGAAAVELALVLPFLIFLFVATFDFARVFYFRQIIQNCARNGAIYLSDPKSADYNLYSSVQNAALADAGSLSPQPTVTSSSGTDSSGNPYVSVTVSWTFHTVTSYLSIPNSVNISSTVQMRQAP
jgi:Flp pilus assembly protein TadG